MKILLSCVLSLASLATCPAQDGTVRLPPGANPATTPLDRGDRAWLARHTAVLRTLATHPDARLLMIGDSITNNYDKDNPPYEHFAPVWQQFYAPRKALNLGFSGDTTANLLWRLKNGEVAGLHPKAAVVLIGINNLNFRKQTVAQTEAGLDAVVADLRTRLPQTNILLLALLPNGLDAPLQTECADVNAYLAQRYGRGAVRRVTYLDLRPAFTRNGAVDTDLFYDQHLTPPGKPLHPNSAGQRRMAEAVEPVLARLMK